MKKIVHRNVFCCNPRKREVSVDETIYHLGSIIRKKRSSKYYLCDQFTSKDVSEIQNWIQKEKKLGLKKNCHVLRQLETATAKNKVICKVMGEFFAVMGDTAFKIFYVNVIKMELDNSKTLD